MGYEWLHGSKASAPEPRRCVSLGKVHPPDLRSIHPALTARGQGSGEPCKSRGLRTVLWAAGGEIPPADPAAWNPKEVRLIICGEAMVGTG
jgi:hypothetical protein